MPNITYLATFQHWKNLVIAPDLRSLDLIRKKTLTLGISNHIVQLNRAKMGNNRKNLEISYREETLAVVHRHAQDFFSLDPCGRASFISAMQESHRAAAILFGGAIALDHGNKSLTNGKTNSEKATIEFTINERVLRDKNNAAQETKGKTEKSDMKKITVLFVLSQPQNINGLRLSSIVDACKNFGLAVPKPTLNTDLSNWCNSRDRIGGKKIKEGESKAVTISDSEPPLCQSLGKGRYKIVEGGHKLLEELAREYQLVNV